MTISEKIKSALRIELSGDVSTFLTPGNIERLVREGRTPINHGIIWEFTGQFPVAFVNYQVPPKGLKQLDIKTVLGSNGSFIYVLSNGTQKMSLTYLLTSEQSAEVQRRIVQTEAQ